MLAFFAHSGSFASSQVEVVSGADSGALHAANVSTALKVIKVLFMLYELILVEWATIWGVIHFV